MIYADSSRVRIVENLDGFVVRECDTLATLFGIVAGVFLFGVGGLVMFVLGPMGAMIPVGSFPGNIFAWAVLALFFIA